MYWDFVTNRIIQELAMAIDGSQIEAKIENNVSRKWRKTSEKAHGTLSVDILLVSAARRKGSLLLTLFRRKLCLQCHVQELP